MLCNNAYRGYPMRTTLNLPEALLQEALETTNAKNKTQVIILALEELIRRHNLAKLKQFKGKIDLDIDINTLRGRETC